jgi:rubrerythrin/very-short-patch-repair endonuclease
MKKGLTKLTTKDFIKQATKVHGKTYDYSLVDYKGTKKKVKIICRKHGIFEQVYRDHVTLKMNCPVCFKERRINSNPKLTTKEFIKRAKEVHGDRYDYSKVDYVNSGVKVCIICKEHGEFWQYPLNHTRAKMKCPPCAIIQRANKRRGTTEQFITKAKLTHGNKYDYSKSIFTGVDDKLIIICHKLDKDGKEHGEFKQSAYSHVNGSGCFRCVHKKSNTQPKILTTKGFIEKAVKIHGNRYDYSKIDYKGYNVHVCIICLEHGEFWQRPARHLTSEADCPKCAKIQHALDAFLTQEEFIESAKEVHGDRYDYSLVKYTGMKNKVTIKCSNGHIFKQSAGTHINGHGCPKCNRSKGEIIIEDWLIKNNIRYKHEKTFKGCKDKGFLRFDFYLIDFNMCVEFDGKQHFEVIGKWKNNGDLEGTIRRDKIKTNYCKSNNIKLLRFNYKQSKEEITNRLTFNFKSTILQ